MGSRARSAGSSSDEAPCKAAKTSKGNPGVVRVLVVGECGDGKTTLINALRHPSMPEGEMGKVARGVTKAVQLYRGKDIAPSVEAEYWDTPGVGDMDVTIMQLIAMVEATLQSEQLTDGGLNGVIVTTPVPDCRVKLGAQVVQVLVEKGFVGGGDKWKNVILCGTKKDLAEDGDIECFATSVVPLFFQHAPSKTGPWVTVSKDDYSLLAEAILQLASSKISYQAPSSKDMAEALGEKLGLDPQQMSEELGQFREMIKEQQATIAGLVEDMSRRQSEHAEEMRRWHERSQEVQQQMEREQQEAQRLQQQRDEESRRQAEAMLAQLERQEQVAREEREAHQAAIERARQEAAEESRRLLAQQQSGRGGCGRGSCCIL